MSAIPASIPAPQAVVELINSHCPPGFSVSSVGASVSLFRGASKSPFAAFTYTGEGSVIGIVVAIWRIARGAHGQPVTNITNVSPDVEKMKALVDALEILGWSHALEPTAFARSYLVIEQQTLAEAREAAAQAESRVRALESESADRLDALRVLGYHPDMNLDEWTEARMKQRDATESRVRVLESEVAALRDSEQRAVEASVRQSKTSEDALRILGWNGEDHPEKWAHDKSRAIQEALTEARHQRDRAAKHEGDIGVIAQAYFAAGFGPSPATPGGVASALDKARRRGDALRALGWDGLVDPETWARHCPTENETLAQIRGALEEALGLARQGTARPTIDLLTEVVEARDSARASVLARVAWEPFIRDIVKLTGARCLPSHAGVMFDAIERWKAKHDTMVAERDAAAAGADQVTVAYAGRWLRVCKALGFNPDAEPPTDIAGFIGDRVARAEWQGMDLVEVLRLAAERVPPSEVEAAVVTARNHLRRGDASSAQSVLERASKLEIKPVVATATRLEDGRVRVDFPAPGKECAAEYLAGINNPSAQNLGKPATIGVRFTMEPGDGVDVARVLSTRIRRVESDGGAKVRYMVHDGKEWVEAPARAEQPKTVQTPLFVADGDSRFKIADARRWKRGVSTAQDRTGRTGRVWITAISGSCAGMTGLPFKPGPAVRFVDANDKLVLAGKVVRYEAKNLGDRLEWEAEVLHEVDVPRLMRDVAADAKAPRVTDEQRQSACFIVGDKVLAGPRWTGITWMSSKGRAKTCRIEGLTFSAGPLTTVIKVPTSPYDLPTKLVRHIHGKKTLAFHVGSGKVITGIVDMVDASAISSMLLFVAT